MEKEPLPVTALLVRDVPFYEDNLPLALVDDIPYVAIRPIAQFLGLDWSAQYRRTQRDDILAEDMRQIIMTTANGKHRNMVSIPLELLPGWLFGITESRATKPEYAAKIRRYRRECFRVLWRAYQTDLAPAFSAHPQPGDSSTLLQVRGLGLAVAQLAEQQIEMQEQINAVDAKINLAEQAVQDFRQRLETVEQVTSPKGSISDKQAAEISNLVKALAVRLTQKDPSKNHYQSIFAELYRRFQVSSYKLIKQGQYQAVLKFLDDWQASAGLPKKATQDELF